MLLQKIKTSFDFIKLCLAFDFIKKKVLFIKMGFFEFKKEILNLQLTILSNHSVNF